MSDSSWIDDPKNTAAMDDMKITVWTSNTLAEREAARAAKAERMGTGCTCSRYGPTESPSRRPIGLRDALCPLHGNRA